MSHKLICPTCLGTGALRHVNATLSICPICDGLGRLDDHQPTPFAVRDAEAPLSPPEPPAGDAP